MTIKAQQPTSTKIIVNATTNLEATVSTSNSSTTNLAAGNSYTFTGTAELNSSPDVMLNLYADQDTTIQLQFSQNGTNWDSTITKYGKANSNEFVTAVKGARYFRVVVTTASLTTTVFRLQTQFGIFRQGNLPHSSQIQQDSDALVVRGINEEEIIQSKIAGHYILNIFGHNEDVDAAEDVWNYGGDYTGFPTASAENFEVLSSSINDTSAGTGARTVRIYYLNSSYEMFDSSGNYLYTDVTMNGTTGVDSGVAGMRVWKAEVISSGSGGTNAGNITVRWKTTTSNIFQYIDIGYGVSNSTAFTIPSGYTGYIKAKRIDLNDTTTNDCQVAYKTRVFNSNTFTLSRPNTVTTSRSSDRTYYGGLKFEEKTDIVLRVISITNANGDLNGAYDLLLVKNV